MPLSAKYSEKLTVGGHFENLETFSGLGISLCVFGKGEDDKSQEMVGFVAKSA